jgi:hypothetical protein
VGLERGSLSLVSTTERLLGRTISGSDLERREYGLRDPSRWLRRSLCPHMLALTSPTQTTEFSLFIKPTSQYFQKENMICPLALKWISSGGLRSVPADNYSSMWTGRSSGL